MKHNFNRIFASIAFLMLIPLALGAQGLKGSYFLDGSIQRTYLNPAFMPRSNYINLPGIGGMQADIQTTAGLSTFLYPKNGRLYTFLNKNVSAEEFTQNLPDDIGLNLKLDVPVLDLGFFLGDNGFLTVDVGAEVFADGIINPDLLRFLKLGMDSDAASYDLSGTNISQSALVHAGVGYTMDLSDKVPGLSVGAKFKYLALVDYASVDMEKASLNLTQDKWVMDSKISDTVVMGGLTKDASASGIFPYKMGGFGLAGSGVALDLGVEYELPFQGIKLSASVLNLGALSGKNGVVGTSNGSVSYEGLKNVSSLDDITGDNSQLSKSLEDLEKLIDFAYAEGKSVAVSTLPRIYLGVEYPFNDKMSAGLLFSNVSGFHRSVSELTASFNYKPTESLRAAVDASFLSAGASFGFDLEFLPKAGVAIALGTDSCCVKVSPQFIPINPVNTNFHLGISIALGGGRE